MPLSNAIEASRCAAVDSFHQACSVPTTEGAKWCSRHDGERKKLYAGYKAHHAAFDAFPKDKICPSAKAIRNCSSYDAVKGWSHALRNKYTLLNRCIDARAYFTERFFGNDMDFGHKTFWHSLNKQRDEIELLLETVEERAYELLLASQNAMWVLDQHQASTEGEECANQDEEPLSKPQTVKPSWLDDVEDIEDPLDVALREKRDEIWEKIWTRLARYSAPYESRYYNERVAIIWATVCRAIYTDPALMLLAQNYKNVTTLLSDATLDLPTVEKLWKAIKSLYIPDIRAAIEDVLFPLRTSGDYVTVFGVRVHKELSGGTIPMHGWGHMTAFFACYSCVRKACKTVDEIIAFTRYAILSNEQLAQSTIRYEWKYEAARELCLCGFVPNTIEDVGARCQVEKCNCPTKRCDRPHWTETKNNNAVCVGLSIDDPHTQLFINALLRDPDFMVLCRKGPNGRKIRSKPLCGSQHRRANTRAGLKKAMWDSVDDTFFRDTVLEEARPLITPGKFIEDCFQVAIVDGGEGGVSEFLDKLLGFWYQVYEVADFKGLITEIGGPLLESGEFEIDEKRKNRQPPLIPNLESDILVSYRRFWGRGPREGRLVDDEANTQFYETSKYS